jgi:xylulokinase
VSGVVVGVDSSTQSCKVVVVDVASGEIVSSAAAPHPEGTAVDPYAWLDALKAAWDAAGIAKRGDVIGVGIAGQQHGMVALDGDGRPVHDALLWNDLRSAPQAERMIAELGVAGWVEAVSVVPLPAITLTKLAWLHEERPEAAAQVRRVAMPHDWLVLQLTGAFSTDRSEASGTGYFNAATGSYRTDLVVRYFGRVPELPLVLPPVGVAGSLLPEWGSCVPVSAGMGDNAAAALGLGLEPGDVAISVGTSGAVFSRSAQPVVDPSGLVAGFASASGDHLALVCTLNAARVLAATAQLLGTDLDTFDALALAGGPDAEGLTMLPYFDGERTPNLPGATGQLAGLTRSSFTPANLARASVLAIANSLTDCVELLQRICAPVARVFLIGGGAKSTALQKSLADTLGVPVLVPEQREYVALGAAKQAAWAATGLPPQWDQRIEASLSPSDAEGAARYRARYTAMRSALIDQAR